MKFWRRPWWIVQLWRIIVLSLFLAVLVLGVALWVLTNDLSRSMFFITYALVGISSTAIIVKSLFSVNIFRRRIGKLHSRSERLFIYMSAVGLYLSVVATIFFVTSFLLLQLMHIPRSVSVAIIGTESALFLIVGYISFARLRRYMQPLSKTKPS